MGRNKIKIEKITDERSRNVTLYKRKKGLLKKAMELSLLCGVKVFLLICESPKKMTQYCSDTIDDVSCSNVDVDFYSNEEYISLFNAEIEPKDKEPVAGSSIKKKLKERFKAKLRIPKVPSANQSLLSLKSKIADISSHGNGSRIEVVDPFHQYSCIPSPMTTPQYCLCYPRGI